MPQFKDINGKQFIEDYNGVEIFKTCAPKLAKLPKFAYKPFYNTPTPDVVATCLKLGKCTKEEAEAVEKAFNEKYGNL